MNPIRFIMKLKSSARRSAIRTKNYFQSALVLFNDRMVQTNCRVITYVTLAILLRFFDLYVL